MSAHDQMRAMLDELMGTTRDGDSGRNRIKFDDPRTCKSFLLGCCPHDILSSTRMDLGDCPKHHDLALRADYDAASKKKDYYYDIDAMEHLQSFIQDCDARTEVAKRRLKETQEELSEEANSKADNIHQLGEEIGTKLAQSETMGAEGKVEESMRLLEEVEELKRRKAMSEQEYKNSMPASNYQQQKLRVCEICSAYLGIHDNDRRLADHFGGKLHLGFIKIREKLEELKGKVAERIKQRGEEREAQRKKREEERQKEEEERNKRKTRSHSKNRSRSRSRSRRRRSRTRSRSRNRRRRTRSRSRSRSRHSKKSRRRSRSRSRKHSRRSRSRSRSRSRRRRRSRSRSRRSRSRDRSDRKRRRSQTRSKSKSRRSRSEEKKNGEKSMSPSHSEDVLPPPPLPPLKLEEIQDGTKELGEVDD